MTDVASLKLAVDSTDVKSGVAALDGMTAAGKKTATSANQLEAALKAEAIAAERAAKGLVTASSAAGKLRMQQGLAAEAMDKVTATSGSAKAGMQQLGFQLNDVAAQFAMGTKASTIFAQQSGQVVQALQLMAGGTSKFAAFMGGPWGIALTAATVVLVPFIARMFDSNEEAEKGKKVHQGLADVLRDGKSSWVEITEAAADYARQQKKTTESTLDAAAAEALFSSQVLKSALGIRERLAAEMELQQQKLRDLGTGRADMASMAGFGDVGANIAAINVSIKGNSDAIKALTSAAGAAQDKVAGLVAGLRSSSDKMIAEGFDQQRKAVNNANLSYAEQVKRLTEINKAEQAATEATKQHTAAQREFGREIDVQQARSIAQGAGFRVTSGQRTMAEQQWLYDNRRTKENPVAYPDANAPHIRGRALDIAFGPGVTVASIKKAYSDMGVHLTKILKETGHYHIEWANKAADGIARAHEAAAKREAEAYKKAQDEITRSFIEVDNLLRAASVAMAANDNAVVQARLDEIGEAAQRSADAIIDGFEKAREEARRLDDELRDVVSTLEGLGGLGQGLGTVGRIFGTLQSGQDRLGGAYGPLLENLARVQWSAMDKAGNRIIRTLGEELSSIFGKNGEFTRILQGAGIGMSIGGAVGGGGTGSQIGGALGGAAGNYFAPAVTKAIGGVVGGVLGAALPVIGGIIGGLIGGLFKKAKTGSASVTQSGISIGGNNADAKGNTSGIGGSVQGSLAKIIEALGGTAGSYGFSIGQREDEFRVSGTAGADVTGKNPGGLLYRGKSAEEAARVALLNALNDGAVAGIREGASNLLKAGKDLESALAKALKFNAVFDELAKEADPVQYAMDALNKELADLKGIFDEAGASASDYAALEELSAIKRAKAYNEAIAPQRDLEIQILRLEGKELEATNAERAMELAGLNATLRPLQERVYALTDETIAAQKAAEAAAQLAAAQEEAARAAAEAAARIETERAELTMRLLELQDSAAAKTMRRMQELAAITDDANRAIQAQIFVQEDINEARAKLSDAYKRERAELGATADKFRQFADGLRAFRDTLYDNDNGLLSYSAAKARLRSVGAAAALGSTEAMGNLPGVSRAFLDASKESSRTLLDYQRDVATVARYVDKAIGAADGAVSNAERQIEALDKSVEGLLSIDEQVITVREAIDNLNALLVPPTAEMAELQKVADKAAADFQLRLVQEVRGMREESNVTAMRMVELTAKMERLWTRFETDGLKVRGDVEDPVYTVAA